MAYAGLGWLAHTAVSYLTKDVTTDYPEEINRLEEDAEFQRELTKTQLTILEQTITIIGGLPGSHRKKSAADQTILTKQLMWGQQLLVLQVGVLGV